MNELDSIERRLAGFEHQTGLSDGDVDTLYAFKAKLAPDFLGERDRRQFCIDKTVELLASYYEAKAQAVRTTYQASDAKPIMELVRYHELRLCADLAAVGRSAQDTLTMAQARHAQLINSTRRFCEERGLGFGIKQYP